MIEQLNHLFEHLQQARSHIERADQLLDGLLSFIEDVENDAKNETNS